MSLDDPIYKEAKEIAQKATTLDEKKDYAEAIKCYENASERFLHVMKFTKTQKLREIISPKVDGYLTRAEELKQFLADEKKRKADAAKNEKKAAPEGGGDNADESELRLALDDIVKVEKPSVKWEDVAGLTEAKAALEEAVILPIKYPHFFSGKREAWKGILLFGPPGTGKSYIAKAIANKANESTFIAVSSSDLVSKWQGQSERLVKMMFTIAREKAPTILFVDEVDSMCGARGSGESESSRRIKTEFLVQMSGVTPKDGEQLLTLAATNTPWSLDIAMRRRFEKKIYISLPDEVARMKLFEVHLGKTRNSVAKEDFLRLAKESEGYSGADIEILCKDAIFAPIRNLMRATHFKWTTAPTPEDPTKMSEYWMACSPGDPEGKRYNMAELPGDPSLVREADVTYRDFQHSLRTIKPTVVEEDLIALKKWADEFASSS